MDGDVRLAMVAAGALVAVQIAGKATRDVLFLSGFSPRLVPTAMIVSAAVSAASVLAFARALTRYGPAKVVPRIFLASGVLLLVEWMVGQRAPRAGALLVYLHMASFGVTVTSAFWSVLNERFDPHTAKRVVARITSGGTLGGIAGGLVAWRIAHATSTMAMLLPMAGMSFAAMECSRRIARGIPEAPAARPAFEVATGATPGSTEGDPARSGLAILRRAPYLQTLALLVLLGAMIQALLDVELSLGAVQVLGRGESLMTLFALFYVGTGCLSFIVQTLAAGRVLDTFGLSGTVATLPLSVVLACFGVPLLPPLGGVLLVRGTEATVRGSLFRAAYELFYTPLAPDEKRATKALIDVGCDRVGTTLGSILTVVFVLVKDLKLRDTLFLASTVLLGLVMAAVSRRLHRGYVQALEASLQGGTLELDDEGVSDATTRRALSAAAEARDRHRLLKELETLRGAQPLAARSSVPGLDAGGDGVSAGTPSAPGPDAVLDAIASLRSRDPVRVREALAGATPGPHLVAHVIPLLAFREVAKDAARWLRQQADGATGQLIDALLTEELPLVRRRLARILGVCRSQRAADGLVLALADGDFEVRYWASASLSHVRHNVEGISIAKERLFEAIVRELEARVEGAAAALEAELGAADGDELATEHFFEGTTETPGLEYGLEHVFTLLSLVADRDALKLALLALRTRDPNLRGTALEYLEVVLPDTIRPLLLPLLKEEARREEPGATKRPASEVLNELLESRAQISLSLAQLKDPLGTKA